MVVIFLTACVNPNGMAFTALDDVNIRRQQYTDALLWYLENTSYKIVFVENSNTDISKEFDDWIKKERLEMFTFDGNNYDRSFGKGYGEARILQYGFEHSKFLRKRNEVVVKITGRLICRNLRDIINRYHSADTIYSNIGKDDWGGNIADSSFVIGPTRFWKEYFLPRREELNDTKRFHFEHLLYESISCWKKEGMKHREFWMLPQMEGVSGTTGSLFVSASHRNLKSSLLYLLHNVGYRGYLNPFYRGDPNFVINNSKK